MCIGLDRLLKNYALYFFKKYQRTCLLEQKALECYFVELVLLAVLQSAEKPSEQ